MAVADLLRVRYLYAEAIRYMRVQHPLSPGLAVSLLQDAVEALCAEVLRACGGTQLHQVSFLDHWAIVAKQGQGKTLPYVDEMKLLNRARVSFKHHGQRPLLEDCEKYAAQAHLFLVETCASFFGHGFDSISEADLITDDEMRTATKAAEAAFADGNYEEALNRCADLDIRLTAVLVQYLPIDRASTAPNLRGTGGDTLRIAEWFNNRISAMAVSLRHISIGLAPGEYALIRRALPMRSHSGTKYFRSGAHQIPNAQLAQECMRILLRAVISAEALVASTEATYQAMHPTPDKN